MIQRIQSLLLLISAAVLSICFLKPAWEATSNGLTYGVNSFALTITKDGIATEKSLIYISILLGISIAITLFVIFQYNNRKMQIRLNMMNTLLICMVEVFYFWNIREAKLLIGSAEFTEHFGLLHALDCSIALHFCRQAHTKRRSAGAFGR
jgi:hypothetical protein